MKIEERILRQLDKKKMSRNKLAERAGISRSGLASILSGKKSPTFDTLTKLCRALEIEVEELFDAAEGQEPGDSGEKRLLKYYRCNDDYGRNHILESARAFYYVKGRKEEKQKLWLPQPGPEDVPREAPKEAVFIKEPGELPWLSLEEACSGINPETCRITEACRDFAIAAGESTPYLLSIARPGQVAFFRPASLVRPGETVLVQTVDGGLALAYYQGQIKESISLPFVERAEGGWEVAGCRILGRLIAVR